MSRPATTSRSELSERASLPVLLVVMSAAVFVVVAANTSLTIAVPAIADDFGTDQATVTLITNVYSVVFAGVLLSAGVLADRFGARPLLLAGLVVFLVASVLTGLSPSPLVATISRGLAGLGAAGVFPTTLAILVQAAGEERRTRAVSVWAAVSGAAALLGAFICGAVLVVSTWRVVMFLFAAVALLLLHPVAKVSPRSDGDRSVRLDAVGTALSVVGLAGIFFAVLQIGQLGPGSLVVPISFVVGLGALVLFVWWQRRTSAPLVERGSITDRTTRAGIAIAFGTAIVSTSFTFLAPQFFQYVRDYSALGSAVAFLPVAGGVAVMTPLIPRLLDRVGGRAVGAAGAVVCAAGLGLLALVGPVDDYWPTGAALGVVGVGFAILLTGATTLVVSAGSDQRRSTASALSYVVREAGGGIGGALLGGAVFISVFRSQVTSSDVGLSERQTEVAASGYDRGADLAGRLDGRQADRLIGVLDDAQLAGYQWGLAAGAVVCLLIAVLFAWAVPRRAEELFATDRSGQATDQADAADAGDRADPSPTR